MTKRKLVRDQVNRPTNELVKYIRQFGIYSEKSQDELNEHSKIQEIASFVLLYGENAGLSPMICSSLQGSFSQYRGSLTDIFSQGNSNIGVYVKLFNTQFNQMAKTNGEVVDFENYKYYNLLPSLDEELKKTALPVSGQFLPLVRINISQRDYMNIRNLWNRIFDPLSYSYWIENSRTNESVINNQRNMKLPYLISKICFNSLDEEINNVTKNILTEKSAKEAILRYSRMTGLNIEKAASLIFANLNNPKKFKRNN